MGSKSLSLVVVDYCEVLGCLCIGIGLGIIVLVLTEYQRKNETVLGYVNDKEDFIAYALQSNYQSQSQLGVTNLTPHIDILFFLLHLHVRSKGIPCVAPYFSASLSPPLNDARNLNTLPPLFFQTPSCHPMSSLVFIGHSYLRIVPHYTKN